MPKSDDYPSGFRASRGVKLDQSAENWSVGIYTDASENGFSQEAAACHHETGDLFTFTLGDYDTERSCFHSCEVSKLDGLQQEWETDSMDALPDDVRAGMHKVLAAFLQRTQTTLAPDITDQLLGGDKRFDAQVERLTQGFDPRMLLPPALTEEEETRAAAFAAGLNSRDGDRALSALAMEGAKDTLDAVKTADPDDTDQANLAKIAYYARINETASLETPDTPTYSYPTRRLTELERSSLTAVAAGQEEAAIRRARDWVTRNGRDEGKGHNR